MMQNVGFTTHAAAYIRSTSWDDQYDPFPIPPSMVAILPVPAAANKLYLKSMNHERSLFRFE
jgi:poly(3-hydroxyalkanoate) synthetase